MQSEPRRMGRPTAEMSKRRRARFIELRARNVPLEQTLAELGCTPRLVLRWLDDPELPAVIAAMRHALGLDDTGEAKAA